MQNKYKDLIFTTHALERMREREIKQGDVWVTWKKPDSSRYSKIKGAYIYYRKFGKQKIEVVAKKNEKPPVRKTSGPEEEWIVLSVWSKPSSAGSKHVADHKFHSTGSLWKFLVNKIFKKKRS